MTGVLEISVGDREELERLARSGVEPHRRVVTAKVLLALDDGTSVRRPPKRWARTRTRCGAGATGSRSRVWPVWGWWCRAGDASLSSRRRRWKRSCPTRCTPCPRTGSEAWSTRSMAARHGVGKDTVARIWRSRGLQPWRTETFKLSTDPDFEAKLTDMVGLYVGPPERPRCPASTRRPVPGHRSDPTVAADAPGPGQDDDPRLQAARHYGHVCRAQHRHRRGPAPDPQVSHRPRRFGLLQMDRPAHPPTTSTPTSGSTISQLTSPSLCDHGWRTADANADICTSPPCPRRGSTTSKLGSWCSPASPRPQQFQLCSQLDRDHRCLGTQLKSLPHTPRLDPNDRRHHRQRPTGESHTQQDRDTPLVSSLDIVDNQCYSDL